MSKPSTDYSCFRNCKITCPSHIRSILGEDPSLGEIKKFMSSILSENSEYCAEWQESLLRSICWHAIYAKNGVEICKEFGLEKYLVSLWSVIRGCYCGLKFLKYAHEATGHPMEFKEALYLASYEYTTVDATEIIEYMMERYRLDSKNVHPVFMKDVKKLTGTGRRVGKTEVALIEKYDIPIHPDSLERYNARRLEVLGEDA